MANSNPSPTTRFRAGTSGNPRGRPRSLAARLRRLVALDVAGRLSERGKECVVAAMMGGSLAGDFETMRLMLDMVEREDVTPADRD